MALYWIPGHHHHHHNCNHHHHHHPYPYPLISRLPGQFLLSRSSSASLEMSSWDLRRVAQNITTHHGNIVVWWDFYQVWFITISHLDENAEEENMNFILWKDLTNVLPGSQCYLPVGLALVFSSMGWPNPSIIIQVSFHDDDDDDLITVIINTTRAKQIQ